MGCPFADTLKRPKSSRRGMEFICRVRDWANCRQMRITQVAAPGQGCSKVFLVPQKPVHQVWVNP
jgi:hypothetical protein